jgi:SpoVK/Ycf46/Vps4 family AAA+-type ATPase
MSDLIKGLGNVTGSGLLMRIFRTVLVTLVSLSVLLLFPYYPLVTLAVFVAGILILSLKYPTAALFAGLLLSIPAAYYQDTFFGMMYALLCLVVLGATRAWPALSLALLGWALAISPLSLIAFVPVVVCGLVLGSKEGAKVGLVLAVSLFFIGWMRGMTNLGLIVIPYSALHSTVFQPIPNQWLPLSFLYGARSPDSATYAQLQATLVRNFVDDVTIYVQTACWSIAGYVTGLVASKWRRDYPWVVAAAIGFLPVAGAYAFGSSLYLGTAGFESILALVASVGAALVLQLARSDLLRMTALQKARLSETTAVAQPILEKQQARPELAWDQIGGYGQLKEEIRDSVIMPLQKPDVAKAYGAEPPRGVLLFGPPGCGKTLFMKALAQTLKANFYYVKTSDIVSKWYGESEKRVTDVFALARETSPSILFFDEIDSIAKKRDLYGSDDTTPRLLSLMLAEMDGLEKEHATLLVVGATNKPDMLDEAILRPGRFDRVIYVPPPDKEARKAIFLVHCEGKPVAGDVDYDRLAALAERFSGADIRNVVQITAVELAKKAMKGKDLPPIGMKELTRTIQTYKPSITLRMLEDYEKLRLDFERRVTRAEEELRPAVTFSDIGGLDKVKQILSETMELPLKHPELMQKYGLVSPKGILLFGPPGCGKTLIAKAAAGSFNIAFLTISGAELSQKSASDVAGAIREIFYRARENKPSMIFMDEIESIASSREAATQAAAKPISQLLIEMDGMKDLRDVMVLAATNKPQWIDAALLRPGRFDKIVYVPPPDPEAREAILRICLSESPTSKIDYDTLTKLTDGYSGADISAIVKDAKMAAVRDTVRGVRHDEIAMQDLVDATRKNRPSITRESLEECQRFLQTYGERA